VSLVAESAWGLARGLAVASAATLVGQGVCAVAAASSRRTGRLLWCLHLVPCLTPMLLVGYAWSRFSLSLIRHPGWNQALYFLLVWVRLAPVAALIVRFAPSAMSPEAIHCHRLLGRGRAALGFWLRGRGRAACVAFAVVFLLAFGEFELASLLGIRTWTVVVFDAQVGGLALGESLRITLLPALVEAVLLMAALWLVWAHGAGHGRPPARRRSAPPALHAAVWAVVAGALAITAVVPAFVVLRGTLRGLALMAQTLTLGGDIAASVVFAAAAAACAWLCAGWFLGGGWRGRWLGAFAFCAPGLFGALVLALGILWAFQLPGLRGLADTPAPLVVALTLLLFPFALLLRLLLAALCSGEGVHAAALLRRSASARVARAARGTLWDLRGRGQFWLLFFLFCWAYFDMTAASILAPSRMTPVQVRLYNFMHYGQTAVLSAMVCVTFLVPFVLLAGAGLMGRAVRRR